MTDNPYLLTDKELFNEVCSILKVQNCLPRENGEQLWAFISGKFCAGQEQERKEERKGNQKV